MVIGAVRETHPGESRVALVPAVLPSLTKGGHEVVIEAGAGTAAGYPDEAYVAKGARVAGSREEVLRSVDVLAAVRILGASRAPWREDVGRLKRGAWAIGLAEPLGEPAVLREAAGSGVTAFSMELMPRITRAQSMDALSSMATIAGYKAVLLAAVALPRMMPMMMTAAGTLTPARVLVIGAGVAGLQAIATSRRLGATVHAYDVRPAVKEQVLSLGARFVELPLDTGAAEDRGGYATAQDESFYRRQREMMARFVADSEVVITTAAVPGKKAPVLVTADMVKAMGPGSVVVDLAAERGGNCELTRPDEVVTVGGVTVLGPTNIPASVPFHASQMYAKNVATFLLHLVEAGKGSLDAADEITRETMLTRDGEVVHPRVRELLGLGTAVAQA